MTTLCPDCGQMVLWSICFDCGSEVCQNCTAKHPGHCLKCNNENACLEIELGGVDHECVFGPGGTCIRCGISE